MMPPDSATARSVLGEMATWRRENWQLADVIDLLGTQLAGRKWLRVRRPEPKTKTDDGRPSMPVEEKRRRLASLRLREARRQAKKRG